MPIARYGCAFQYNFCYLLFEGEINETIDESLHNNDLQNEDIIDKNNNNSEIQSLVVVKQSGSPKNISLNQLNNELIENYINNDNDMTFSEDNNQKINNKNEEINKCKSLFLIINTKSIFLNFLLLNCMSSGERNVYNYFFL